MSLLVTVMHGKNSLEIVDDHQPIQLAFTEDGKILEYSIINQKDLFYLLSGRTSHMVSALKQASQVDKETTH